MVKYKNMLVFSIVMSYVFESTDVNVRVNLEASMAVFPISFEDVV